MGILQNIKNRFESLKTSLIENIRHRKIIVDVLAILFGCGSWLAINGMWMELPIMVRKLPESWNLAAYLSVIIQLANIGPIAYSLSYRFCKRFVNSTYVIHAMMATGVIACFSLGFIWNHTSMIGNHKHSVALFVMLFFLALVDCSSSVLFFPFMALFDKKYLTSFLIGESFSGFIPSLVSLGQGAGSSECRNVSKVNTTSNETTYSVRQVSLPPRFSVEAFFFFLSGMMIASWAAFILMRYHKCAQSEKIQTDTSEFNFSRYTPSSDDKFHIEESDQSETDQTKRLDIIPYNHYVLLLALQTLICFLANGFLPTIQTYSALPYGTTAFHLAITLSHIASPGVCVLALFISLPRVRGIVIMVIVVILMSIYLILTASTSPSPPLQGTAFGELLIVTFWVVSSGLISFIKVCIANTLRDKGSFAMFMFGAATQGGSAVGTVMTFLLTVVFKAFHSYHPC